MNTDDNARSTCFGSIGRAASRHSQQRFSEHRQVENRALSRRASSRHSILRHQDTLPESSKFVTPQTTVQGDSTMVNESSMLDNQDSKLGEKKETSPMKYVSPTKRVPLYMGRARDLISVPVQPEIIWKPEDELEIKVHPKYKSNRCYKYCVMAGNYPKTLINTLRARGNWNSVDEEDAIDHANFLFRPVNFGHSGYNKMNIRGEFYNEMLVFNHFEVLRDICTKSGLIRSLDYYYRNNREARTCNYTVFDTTPTTYLVTLGLAESGLNPFINRFKEIAKCNTRKERTPMKHCSENIWLVKPENWNQGRGIQIYKNLKDIQQFLFSQPVSTGTWVLQKYIEKPYLYKQRKFDVRQWALVTNSFEIYIYKPGYLRTSSDSYNLKSKNNYVHLTNQCLQNKSDQYQMHEEGNTLSFDEFQQYLDETEKDRKINIKEHFLERIQDIMIDTFLSARRTLNPSGRQGTYELFGFDFLIDEDYRVWLIEVNSNPYLGMPNDYMKQLLPKMMNDMCKLVLDPIYQPRNVPEPDRPNDFEILYREQQACTPENNKKPVNRRRSFSLESCYPFPELKPVIGLSYMKQKELQNQLLYGRARVGQKMVNTQGLDRSLLTNNQNNNVNNGSQFTNQQADDIMAKDGSPAAMNLNEKKRDSNQQKALSLTNKTQPLHQPFMSKRNAYLQQNKQKASNDQGLNQQIKKPSLLSKDSDAFGHKKISQPDTVASGKPLLKELSKPQIGVSATKRGLQKVGLPLSSQSRTITQRTDETGKTNQAGAPGIKINSSHPAPNYINGVVSNPYNNQASSKTQASSSSQHHPSSKQSRSRSLANSTHVPKKPQLAKSTFHLKESRRALNNVQNSTETVPNVLDSGQEFPIAAGSPGLANGAAGEIDRRETATLSAADTIAAGDGATSKYGYRTTQGNAAAGSEAGMPNNNGTQQGKQAKPLAPWRGGGKTSVFQSGGKYPGGIGGGYSGGSNHGALMRSQSSNNQLPHLVRQKFNSRVQIKQPPPKPTGNALSKTSSKDNLDIKLPQTTGKETSKASDDAVNQGSVLSRPSPLTVNKVSSPTDDLDSNKKALTVTKRESSQLPPISQGIDTQVTTKAKTRDLINLDQSGRSRQAQLPLKKSCDGAPATVQQHKSASKASSIIQEIRHTTHILDSTSRKRGQLQKALQESRNRTATDECEGRPPSNLSGTEVIDEDPILAEALDYTLSGTKKKMGSLAGNLLASSCQKDLHASKIEENIQIIEDSPECKGLATQLNGQDEVLICEPLPAPEDQSCEFGQFKHEVLGS